MRVLRVQYEGTRPSTPEEAILDLMRQAAEIMRSGYMQSAKDQELKRINDALEAQGIDLMVGEEEDADWLVGRDFSQPHTDRCTVDVCHCQGKYRIKINPKEDQNGSR